MENRYVIKAGVFAIVVVLIAVAFAPAIGLQFVEKREKNSESFGWYYKPAYDDYAPSGMPDFSQKQDQWKTIMPGPDGELDSTTSGDDVVSSDGLRIAPGDNCQLESTPSDDDVVKFEFCGPAAVANCFWWFDSKYEYESGQPGDGEDSFPLVEDYGVGDDHSSDNAPLLIEKLAKEMGTCDEGITFIDDMQNAIDDWFVDTGLSYMFEENTYYAPTFQFVEEEIERSQDVILLLGFYDREITGEEKDQFQELCDECYYIESTPPSWQEFVPSVDSLSRVEVKIARTQGQPNGCPITMTIDSPLGTVLTQATLQPAEVPELPYCDTDWMSFDVPDIALVPGQSYYIVLNIPPGFFYHWCGAWGNPYPPGISSVGPDWDWTFRTFYNVEENIRKAGHFVTCAGVNSADQKIAFSDPSRDIANPSGDDHNDAQYVSHDIHSVATVDIPVAGPFKWWLPEFPSGYDYTIVEQAVIICPKPSVEIEKKVWDESILDWVEEIDAAVDEEVMFEIWIHNNGGYPLDNIVVTDTLPSCLEYVTGSAEPSEPSVQGNKLIWNFDGPISYCQTITIRFRAKVVFTGENINRVTVTADTDEGEVDDSDTATVNGYQGGHPSVEIEKEVSTDDGVTWQEDVEAQVCTNVRFQITVHNDGDFDLTNIVVTDTLPECLEYVTGSAEPSEPTISGNKLTWTFPGPLKYCNTITIEFDAHVISEGENINTAEVTADSDGGEVDDSDTATVIGTIGPVNNPPLKPEIPWKKSKPKALPATPTSYTFCTKTTDPDGDQVYYWWDWGDGNNSGWLGLHDSGKTACTSHSYEKGTYTIKVKAKDIHDAESPWSDPFTFKVTVKNKPSVNPLFLQFLERLLDQHPHMFPLLRQLLGL
jgi:uncharacterized repeat protein (TIGR01451 family)